MVEDRLRQTALFHWVVRPSNAVASLARACTWEGKARRRLSSRVAKMEPCTCVEMSAPDQQPVGVLETGLLLGRGLAILINNVA